MPLEDFAEFIAKRLSRGRIVEAGIGFQTKVALRLTELGFDVIAVDWNIRAVENARRVGIHAEIDDLFHPRLKLYRGVVGVYSVRPTPELVPAVIELGKVLGVPVFILPLTGDPRPSEAKLENFKGLPIYVYTP
jgi:uncharacterized UPF0146 family protein